MTSMRQMRHCRKPFIPSLSFRPTTQRLQRHTMCTRTTTSSGATFPLTSLSIHSPLLANGQPSIMPSQGRDKRHVSFSVPEESADKIRDALKSQSSLSLHYASNARLPACACRIFFTPPGAASQGLLSYLPWGTTSDNQIRVGVESDLRTTSYTLLPAVATALEQLDVLKGKWLCSDQTLSTFKGLVEESEKRLRGDPLTAQFLSPRKGLTRDVSGGSEAGYEAYDEQVTSDLIHQIYRSQNLHKYQCDPNSYVDRTLPGEGVVEPTEAQFKDAGDRVCTALGICLEKR